MHINSTRFQFQSIASMALLVFPDGGQRAEQEISLARVGDHLDSMTKNNKH